MTWRARRPLMIALTLPLLIGCAGEDPSAGGLTSLRIGWQRPWATQGQIAMSLANTNALEVNGLDAVFRGFTFGAPLNEAALSGEVDVIFTADQPAASLLARNDGWRIIARLMYNRVAIYVPPESAIRSPGDLKGQTLAMPFGAAAQREALKAVAAAGLDPNTDIQALNLDIYEHAGVVNSGTRSSWGEIDALAGFDPTPAILEESGAARIIHESSVVSVVMMSEDFTRRHAMAPTRFLKAFIGAYDFYARNVRQANAWFRAASGLDVSDHALGIAAAVEPNLTSGTWQRMRFDFTPNDVSQMQEGADFLLDQGLIGQHVSMGDHIDLSYLEAALAELKANPSLVEDIRASGVRG